VSDGLYKDAKGRYNYDLVGGLDNSVHTIKITAKDDSNNVTTLNSAFTTSGQPQVTFTVTLDGGGAAEGAQVSISGTGKTAAVGNDGKAVIGLANGTYSYTVTMAGRKTETGEVTVYGDTEAPAVTLIATYDVDFTVTMNDGTTPVVGAVITITSGSDTVAALTTGADGKASTRLVNGNYSFEVSKEDFATSAVMPFTVNGAAMPGLTVNLNRVVYCTVTEGQVAIEFKPYSQLISSSSDRNVIVMYAIYEGKRMIGMATKTALLTVNGISDSATITFNTKYAPDTCKVFIMNDYYKPEVPNFIETLN